MSISIPDQKVAQPRRGVCSIQRTRGNRDGKIFPFVTVWSECKPIESRKYKTRSKRCSFVAVDERMVAAEVKQISRCDIYGIAQRRHTIKTGLRSGNGEFQKRAIPNPVGTAKLSDGFGMDLETDLSRQIKAIAGRIARARRFMVLEYCFIVSLMRDVIFSRGVIGTIGATVIVPPWCNSTFTSSPTLRRASCRSTESKMIP